MKGTIRKAILISCCSCDLQTELKSSSLKSAQQEVLKKGWGFNANSGMGWTCPDCRGLKINK